MSIGVSFPGGKRVDAQVGDFVIRTDQSPRGGGEGSAPEPFALFLASLATCAGVYVLGFCQARDLPTEGLALAQHHRFDPLTGKLEAVEIEVTLPPGFPAKYRDAVLQAAAGCKVKKVLHDPPDIVVRAVESPERVPGA